MFAGEFLTGSIFHNIYVDIVQKLSNSSFIIYYFISYVSVFEPMLLTTKKIQENSG